MTEPELVDTFELPVQSIKVEEFARAAWDQDGAHLRGEPILPTFLGAAAQMMAREHPIKRTGLNLAHSFHGEERVLQHRAVHVGDMLRVLVHASRLPDGLGRRAGRLRRFLYRSSFHRGGDLVAVVDRIILESERVPSSPARPAPRDAVDPGLTQRPDPLGASARPWNELRSGDRMSARFADLTRTDFVRYAGASGDLTAVHFDDRVAQLNGAPVAFAMGMLSGAFIGHVLSDMVALDGRFDLAIRFRDQVWPGDSLTVSADVESVDEEAAVVLLNCVRDEGTSVTTGRAQVGRTRAD